MNKSLATILIIAVLAIAGGGAYYMYNQANKKTDTATQNSTSQQNTAKHSADMNQGSNSSDSQTSQTNAVEITDFAYSPASITVKKGTTVTWTNKDSVAHTVTSDSGKTLDSPSLAKGKSFSFTFNEPGTFTYHCTPHPNMKGTVTVTE